ncbi:MAG: UDP-N-acetylmuramate dehydrogenase [Coriobacteriia bacterium]|nr:UDP-N-acetylmuramate dehydrogenase [Coriobacteriia bacterium]
MPILDAYSELRGSLDGNVYLDEPMNRHTSFHIGGPVSLYVECASVRDLHTCLKVITAEQMPWVVIGKGSNLLVSDEGWRGMVLTLAGQFREIIIPTLADEQPGEGALCSQSMVVGAGVILANLVQTAFKHGFSGFEFAVGIPGSLGGALAMNAGTATEGIGSIVSKLTVYRPQVGLMRVLGSDLPWSYRSSGISPGDIIVEAELLTKPGNISQIQAKMEAALGRRKATQPLTKPSAGSVFRNPPDTSVGRMIEHLGLKGYRVGGAEVSLKHANFIVNNGSATAADVLAIIREVSRRVKDEYGTKLQTEIRFVGFE